MSENEKHTDKKKSMGSVTWTLPYLGSDHPNFLQLSSLSKNPALQKRDKNRPVSSFASNHIYSLVANKNKTKRT